MTAGDARRDEIAHGLESVHARITEACADAGRDPSGVDLVVVTKFFPVSDVRLLTDLGIRDVGENRDQEAREKLTDPLLDGTGLRRHFIGQLQSNMAASVVSYADVVHTADRAKIVRALGKAADRQGRRPRVLVQVSLDDDQVSSAHRGGARIADVPALADLVAAEAALELGGVMAVAPLGGNPDAAFARLWQVATGIQAAHPDATWVSAGMSDDLEAAIRHGATHLRVGSAILGSRPLLR
jgi:pyridoxal phosphate enzyme (YggS family)